MPTETVQDIATRPILLGDGGYPLTSWLIIPCKFSVNLSQSEKKFNKSLSSSCLNVERAFGILKARCKSLLKRLGCKIENVSSFIITCVMLHNICQIAGDDYVDHGNILETIIAQEQRARTQRRENGAVTRNGAVVRNALKQFIGNNNQNKG